VEQRIGVGSLLAIVATAGQLLTGTSASAQPTASPTFRADAEYVEVDAVVTDKDGNFVRNLTRDDFRVLEDGNPRNISTFLTIDVPVAVPADAVVPASGTVVSDVQSNVRPFDGRVYIIVLDDLHVDPIRSERAKQSARLFIERYVGADDRAAVIFTGTSSDGQPFTSDKGLLLTAIDKFLGRKLQSATLARNERYGTQRAIVDAARAQGSEAAVPSAPDPYDEERAQNARSMLASLRTAAGWLGPVHDRRKTLLLISEGIDYDIDEIIRPRTSTGPPSAAVAITTDIRDTLATTARTNVSIYAVDPRGLTSAGEEAVAVSSFAAQSDPGSGIGPGTLANELRLSQESLRWLAEDSGGFAAVNRNDTTETFDRIVRDNSSYYVLAYYQDASRTDGKFHRIDVELRRPGLTVHARRGYVAPSGRSSRARNTMGLAPELFDALNSPVPAAGLPLHVFAVPLKNTAADASVVVGIEIAGRALSLATRSRLDVSVAAFDTKGKVFGPVNDTLTLSLRPETRTSVEQRGVRLLTRLTLPIGRYQLHVAARDRETGVVGSVVFDLDVPDFGRQPVSTSAPLVASRERASMLTARPDRRLASLLSAPPTAVRSFAQDDELAVFSQVYDSSGNAPHSVEIVMSVSTPDGTPVFADRDTRPSGERSNSTAIHDFVSRVPLTGLAPGEYILSVEAKSQLAAEAAATRRVHFTVVAAALRSPVSVPTATARASAPTFLAVDPEYSSLVTQYRRGNVQAAIASLAKWPSERVRAVTRNGTGAIGLDVRQTEAAVMLHSDVAMFLAALDPRSSRQQLEAAQMLVATLPDEGPAGFRQRWEAYAVGTYLVQHDFRAAQRAVDEGVGRLPRNADLLLMKGTLMELAARSETADFRGTWTTAGGINRMASTIVARMEDTLVAAANAYERALELDPSLTSARLRLGWVYGINHSNAHAREQLRTVANGTSSRELRYLARLFLGGLSDIDGDPEGAYNEYEAAHATLPDAQSGCISLMRAARMTGRTDLEQELLAQYAARPGAGEDPWWYFSMGFDTDLVAWLHARATAP
jgi:VWFA-related protein